MTCFEHELTEIIKVYYSEVDESIVPDLNEFYQWWTEQRDKGRIFWYPWRPKPKWCPHCNAGKIVESKNKLWHFDCTQCGRGFRIDEHGTWHAIGDAQGSTYDAADVQEAQKYWDEYGPKEEELRKGES